MFADRYEPAFGCCRVLQGVGGIAIFLMSNALCMMTKIIFITGACVVTTVAYVILEVGLKRTAVRDASRQEIEVEA